MGLAVEQLSQRARALPGSDAVFAVLAQLPPIYLVGGAVRDLLRGEASVDLDLAVEGDAADAAARIAAELGGAVVEHERFDTATVRAGSLAFDIARTRRERYPRPGALPEVEPATIADDLARRDFSVNAIALQLSARGDQTLIDPHGGARDLEAGLLRALHDKSFVDDPTRILRGLRYEARLGLRLEPATETLARSALASGALSGLSPARLRSELLALLGEARFDTALEHARELGLDRALHPGLSFDVPLAASAALGAGETGADRVLAALAALVEPLGADARALLDRLGLERHQRDRVAAAIVAARGIATALERPLRPSELHGLLAGEPEEALALALAHAAPAEPILRYRVELRTAELEISGHDLIEAGIPPSPAIGRALEQTLRRKLDGEVGGRDEQLRTALELARAEP